MIKAIENFLTENTEFQALRSIFLVYGGKRLPVKHILGMVFKVAYNMEISKDDYSTGMETIRYFERLGFEIVYAGKTIHTEKKQNNSYKYTEVKIT